MPETLYTMHHLYRAAKKMGLRMATKPTYLRYENMGIFKPGKFSVVYSKHINRVFTEQEIAENLARLAAYTKERKDQREAEKLARIEAHKQK